MNTWRNNSPSYILPEEDWTTNSETESFATNQCRQHLWFRWVYFLSWNVHCWKKKNEFNDSKMQVACELKVNKERNILKHIGPFDILHTTRALHKMKFHRGQQFEWAPCYRFSSCEWNQSLVVWYLNSSQGFVMFEGLCKDRCCLSRTLYEPKVT
jgi:hypothetical protein